MDLSPEEIKEVMQIFQSEATDQIKDLNQGLLELEKNPDNLPLLESLFRVAHSIKGASRMLGLTPIELISHELEELLGLIIKR
jgi:two-component system, chemotaxis family, sensor kinase CheA